VTSPDKALTLTPVKLPEDVLLSCPRFSIRFLFNVRSLVTELPITMPLKEVVNAVEFARTRMLLEVTLLPIVLSFTSAGATLLFTDNPVKTEDAGAVPVLRMSIPPTLLPVTSPPVLRQFIPVMREVFEVAVVEVVIDIDPFDVLEPMVLPSPGLLPPIVMPEPLVSMPVNVFEEAAVGTEDRLIEAIVFPLITDAGKPAVVVNCMP